MNVKRLTILRNALIAYAKDQRNLDFDLNGWTDIPPRYSHKPVQAVRGARMGRNYCGTTACACGLAASIPSLAAQGFELNWIGAPLYQGRANWAAVMCFFDLSEEDATELFMASRYDPEERANPVAVSDRITALLETA